MDYYFVNRQAQANGDHEVHKQTCAYLPSSANQLALGFHANCHSAVQAAKAYYWRSNGCYWCSQQCHTT